MPRKFFRHPPYRPPPPTRRKMIGTLAAAGALLGLDATASAASTKKTRRTRGPTTRRPRPTRSSPWPACATTNATAPPVGTRTGGNADFHPGRSRRLRSLFSTSKVPASSPTSGSPSTPMTTCTSRTSSSAPGGMENLRRRSKRPSATSTASCSANISSTSPPCSSSLLMKALNCYFQMPFDTAAQITLTNEGKVRTNNLYFAIDYTTVAALPA